MRTISFYSYKGGTGRTLLVANLAVYAARLGLNVVMVDLDLEAPGLAYKFLPAPPKRPGVLDWLSAPRRPAINDMAVRLDVPDPFNPSGELRLIGAGPPPSLTYLRELRSLQTTTFGDNSTEAVAGMLALRHAIEDQFAPDLLFLDARTGISNTNAITTRVLADEVVALALNTREQLEGTREVLRSLTTLAKPQDSGVRLGLHVVISRIPDPERGVDDAEMGSRDIAIAESVRRYLTEPAEPLANTLDLTADPLLLHNDIALAANEHVLLAAESKPSRSRALHFDYLRVAERLLGDEILTPAIAKAFADINDVQRASRAEFFGDVFQALEAKAPQPLSEFRPKIGGDRASLKEKVTLLRRAAKRDASRQPDYAEALIELAWVSFDNRTTSSSTGLSYLRDARRVYRKLAAYSQSYLPALVDTTIQYSVMAEQLGNHSEALSAAEAAADDARPIRDHGPIPKNVSAVSLANLANIRYRTGDTTGALEAIENAVAIFDDIPTYVPADVLSDERTVSDQFLLRSASAHNLRAVLNGSVGNYPAALQSAESAVAICRLILGRDKDNTAAQAALAEGLNNQANLHRGVGHLNEALSAAHEATVLFGNLAAAQPQTYLRQYASATQTVSATYADRGDYQQAVPYAEHSVHIWQDLVDTGARPEDMIGLIAALNNLAARLAEVQMLDSSISTARRAIELGISTKILLNESDGAAKGQNRPLLRAVDEAVAPVWVNLALNLREQGHILSSLQAARRGVALYEELGSVSDHQHTQAVLLVSELLLSEGKFDAALSAAHTAIHLSEQADAPRFTSAAYRTAARAAMAADQRNEAIDLAKRAVDIARRLDDRTGWVLALENLGDIYAEAGWPGEAQDVRERATRIRSGIVTRADRATS